MMGYVLLFSEVNTSMKERAKQKVTLDPSLLEGPTDLELKGAKVMDAGTPSFIWTFTTQQVNCLYDGDGNIIEGAVDDIRQVYYAMVLRKHPEPEAEGLEYINHFFSSVPPNSTNLRLRSLKTINKCQQHNTIVVVCCCTSKCFLLTTTMVIMSSPYSNSQVPLADPGARDCRQPALLVNPLSQNYLARSS